jgi:catabolite regulation protein CreA
MTPVVFSTIMNKKSGTEWFRAGKDVVYKKGNIPR